jgi:hypothetical protein
MVNVKRSVGVRKLEYHKREGIFMVTQGRGLILFLKRPFLVETAEK